jgi:hypothetical protein
MEDDNSWDLPGVRRETKRALSTTAPLLTLFSSLTTVVVGDALTSPICQRQPAAARYAPLSPPSPAKRKKDMQGFHRGNGTNTRAIVPVSVRRFGAGSATHNAGAGGFESLPFHLKSA